MGKAAHHKPAFRQCLLMAESVSLSDLLTPDVRPPASRPGATAEGSDLGLLRYLEGVIDLDAEVSHRRLELRVPQQQLHGA